MMAILYIWSLDKVDKNSILPAFSFRKLCQISLDMARQGKTYCAEQKQWTQLFCHSIVSSGCFRTNPLPGVFFFHQKTACSAQTVHAKFLPFYKLYPLAKFCCDHQQPKIRDKCTCLCETKKGTIRHQTR